VERRDFLITGAAVVTALASQAPTPGKGAMYGLIGKITTAPGKRDELIAILLGGTASMPGCLSYVVAHDTADPDAVWITEVWDSAASHAASLSLPSVREAIAKGKPLIAGFSNRVETVPIGGPGLSGTRGGN
jgi:quinol monooxygenase YgiN